MIHIVKIESKKAIYDTGTEIRFKKLDSHKHIKNWEIQDATRANRIEQVTTNVKSVLQSFSDQLIPS